MNVSRLTHGISIVWLAAVLLLAACTPLAVETPSDAPAVPEESAAAIQLDSGGEVPFYARFGENETFDDGEHAVIVFYRPPECIPPDFNLNQFFHFPGENGPGAFACAPATMTGIETWQHGPDIDAAPLVAEMAGRGAVPVWFFDAAELQDAQADGEVTIADLTALPSRRTGTASNYTELLHPSQSNAQPLIQFTAGGALDDGTPFSVEVSYGAADVDDHTTITFDQSAVAGAIPTVTFTATEYAYDGPSEIPGGLTRIELVNAGAEEHGLWLLNMTDGKSLEDFMGFMASLESNPDIPEWLTFYGGVTAPSGSNAAYTVDLPAGDYLLISVSGEEPDVVKGMAASLTVTAAERSAVDIGTPAADLRIELVDFSYIIDGEPQTGPQVIEVANSGMEPHEVILLKLAEGGTTAEAIEFLMAGEEAEGPPTFEFYGGTGPQSAGVTAWYEVDVVPGEYGIICFVGSAANGGAPHFALGMSAQVSVR